MILAIFILLMGITNYVGGRTIDIVGKIPASRAIFRCIIPALLAGALIFLTTNMIDKTIYAMLAVGFGSALWFPWGWSFDEINGAYDAGKYPNWVQKIGLWVYPLDILPSTNKKRGILMKGTRGAFDILTFSLLSISNPWDMFFWLPTFTMGIIYWLSGKINYAKAVPHAEFAYGCLRGFLIGMALIYG